MPNEPIQGLPYPALTGAPPNVPADIKALADAVVGRTVMRFASVAARDAALPSPVDGMVCYVAADSTYYARVGGKWVVFWSDTGWQPIAPAAGFTAGSGADAPQVCRVGRQVLFRGFISGPLSTGGSTIGTIPAGYRARTLNDTATAGALTNGGTCRIATGTSGAIVVHVSSNVTTGASLKALSGYLVD